MTCWTGISMGHTLQHSSWKSCESANLFGQANGAAIGMAPLAHLAMYKVSAIDNKAGESEILAAMDAAIDDGVDVLSLSLGLGSHPFYDDAIATGAFAAIQKGIFVSCSAGNEGPLYRTLSNEAPWILTPKHFPSSSLPLVYASCKNGSLKNVDVKGKIVFCEGGSETVSKGKEVKRNGGAAMIVMNYEYQGSVIVLDYEHHVLPASRVSYMAGLAIKAYINSTSSPTATILFKGTVTGVPAAPQVAWFSSRGPSIASPGILKPDIIGPGVNILAAYPVSDDHTTNRFGMISGTSMSCPHLSGIAALLKSAHPNWSPAAIKSAIMTTASLYNLGGKPIPEQRKYLPATVFDIGAGQVNPSRASDPGLIYDLKPDDYVPYLCGLGYSDKHVGLIVKRNVKCSNDSSIPEAQLNYPSFSIELVLLHRYIQEQLQTLASPTQSTLFSSLHLKAYVLR
ncbi:hypothetical protein GH714_026502 [Hevea brasiliensis]|uniref:Peptidase S8/S53 domain-containing protein n=1 Tax=Hevea brasiliensis TaxID=3981 RepID=A0A6A6LWJ5_HEVBR|nr:hypothetical protein GH714_026502 [Hevea brasiliensis]